jgi:Na+/melibiose symporter-like transporter
MLSVTNNIFVYVLILSASAIADKLKTMGDGLQGLAILRLIALVFMGLDIFFLFKVKEYPNDQDGKRVKISRILLDPFKEKKYLLTVLIACLWTFTASIPGPYYSIYLLKDLGVSYSYINVINMLNIPIVIILTPIWARRIRRTSWFATLSISMGFYLISYIGLAFVSANTLYLYPIFLIVAFAFAPGITLTFANIPYINIPQNNQTRYIGFYSSMNTLAALVALTLGRKFILYTEEVKFRLLGIEMRNKQCIYLLAAFLMLLATIAISFLSKKAQEKTKDDTV